MKKIHSKVGDVFETVGANPKKYIQLVHIDPVQMNSDVVVVYGERSGEFDFYAHTTVEQGLLQNLWQKTDRDPIDCGLGELSFKQFMEDVFDEGLEPYWYYWTCLDTEWRKVGLDTGAKLDAVDGSIYPASDIIYRITNGRSEFKVEWPVKGP